MPGSTAIGGVVTYTVKVGGSPIPDTMPVLSVHVDGQVNRVPTATIVLLDGSPDSGSFAASSSSTFVPGGELTVEAGYDNVNQLIFKGIITQQSIRINDAMGSTLEVVCRDATIRMTVGRKSVTWTQQTDSAIISTIAGNYSGVSATVTSTPTTWPAQVQYYVSDWDYIIARAEANGMIVTAINGKLTVAAPNANTSPVLTATYGDTIYEFNADLNAVTQLSQVKANAWDYKNQALATGQASNNVPGPGNLSSTTLAGVVNASNYLLQTQTAAEDADLTNWCKAELVKSEYSKITGQVKIDGSSLPLPAAYITLAGLGDRFNGDHFISGVVHDIADGHWYTEISIGMSPVWFTEEPDVMAPPASGLLPGVRGLFPATVKQGYNDPDSQYRILVDVPLLDPAGAGIWARLSNFYSTSGAGAFFIPETGDEVILGFLNEDPRYPVILGSLYSSSKIKPFTGLDPDEKNQFKAIVSKQGIYMKFDDVDKILTVATPGSNTMVWSDKEKQISITDENGNSIVMSSSGITMKSPKDITIQADQNVNITGMQGISIKSSGGDVQVNGLNIKETASVQYSAQGVTAQVQADAALTLKGAMVMIN